MKTLARVSLPLVFAAAVFAAPACAKKEPPPPPPEPTAAPAVEVPTPVPAARLDKIVVTKSVQADKSPGEAAASFGKKDTVYVSFWVADAPVGNRGEGALERSEGSPADRGQDRHRQAGLRLLGVPRREEVGLGAGDLQGRPLPERPARGLDDVHGFLSHSVRRYLTSSASPDVVQRARRHKDSIGGRAAR